MRLLVVSGRIGEDISTPVLSEGVSSGVSMGLGEDHAPLNLGFACRWPPIFSRTLDL